MKVACRWPGGMTLALTRTGAPPLTVNLAGPRGQPSLLPTDAKPPSRYAATMLQKRVVDTVRQMQDSADDEHEVGTYGVTDVSDQFWADWYQQNADFDVVKHRMVFALGG